MYRDSDKYISLTFEEFNKLYMLRILSKISLLFGTLQITVRVNWRLYLAICNLSPIVTFSLILDHLKPRDAHID